MKPVKCAAYIHWLHEIGCLACQRLPVHAHHVRRSGERGDDMRAVPLCFSHHMWGSPTGVHRLGKRAWQARFGVDLEAEIGRLNLEWQSVKRK